jgi:general secretion pathway protein C
MTLRQTPIVIHLLGAAAASALAAYWALQLLATPASSVTPAAAPVLAVRDPDPRLAARLFGDLTSGPAAIVRNVQVAGVYASGKASSAVVAVDGKPARAVLLGQEAAAGLRLVDVRSDGITLETDGVRTDYTVPPLSLAHSSGPAPQFRREGNTLTAPMQDPSAAAGSAPQRPGPGRQAGGAAPPSNMLVPPRNPEEPGGRLGQPGPATPPPGASGG